VQLKECLVRYHNEPICIRLGYVRATDPPTRFVDRAASVATVFPVVFGSELAAVECTIEMSRADAATSRLLGIDEGAPLLLQEVLLLDESGAPRELSYTHFRSDLVTLSVFVPADQQCSKRQTEVERSVTPTPDAS
jgi:DNA-binding GntR family transcriptional regulator